LRSIIRSQPLDRGLKGRGESQISKIGEKGGGGDADYSTIGKQSHSGMKVGKAKGRLFKRKPTFVDKKRGGQLKPWSSWKSGVLPRHRTDRKNTNRTG